MAVFDAFCNTAQRGFSDCDPATASSNSYFESVNLAANAFTLRPTAALDPAAGYHDVLRAVLEASQEPVSDVAILAAALVLAFRDDVACVLADMPWLRGAS